MLSSNAHRFLSSYAEKSSWTPIYGGPQFPSCTELSTYGVVKDGVPLMTVIGASTRADMIDSTNWEGGVDPNYLKVVCTPAYVGEPYRGFSDSAQFNGMRVQKGFDVDSAWVMTALFTFKSQFAHVDCASLATHGTCGPALYKDGCVWLAETRRMRVYLFYDVSWEGRIREGVRRAVE